MAQPYINSAQKNFASNVARVNFTRTRCVVGNDRMDCGRSELFYSADGTTWTASMHPFTSWVYGVVACDGIWVAVGSGASDSIARSTDDGATFTGLGIVGGNKAIACADTLSPTRWVAVGNSGSKIAISIDGGATWAGQDPALLNFVFGIAFSSSQGRWVVCGNAASGGVIGVSTDSTATAWTFFSTLDASSFLKPRAIYNGGRWVITGSMTSPRGTYFSIDNGASWTFEEFGGTIPTDFIVYDARFANGRFVLAGKFGNAPPTTSAVIYSTTGVGGTWIDSGYTNPTNVSVVVALAYSPSQSLWLTVSPDNLATSPDAISWTGPLSSPLTSASPTAVICAFDSFSDVIAAPTESPTSSPTVAPTESPTSSPTVAPTESPTNSPTAAPTESPTSSPTAAPTESPTSSPTAATGPIEIVSSSGSFVQGDAIIVAPIVWTGNVTINGTLSINSTFTVSNQVVIDIYESLTIGEGVILYILADPIINTTAIVIIRFAQLNGIAPEIYAALRSTDQCTVLANDAPVLNYDATSLTITATITGTDSSNGCTAAGNSTLSIGVIVGIALGSILVGIAAGFVVLIAYRRQRAKTTELIRRSVHSQMATTNV